MKIKSVAFNKGIQYPAKLGTIVLKPTADGKASYAQNIDVSNDEYGNSVVVPGPAITTIGNNSELTGVPIVKVAFNESATPKGMLYMGQGTLGTKTTFRRIKDILSGSTPVIDTAFTDGVVDHSSHTNLQIVDVVYRPDSSSNFYIYFTIKDDTDTVVYKFAASDSNPNVDASVIATNTTFTGGYTDQFLVFSSFDNNIYWIGRNRVDSINSADTHTVATLALGLPLGTFASCGADWQQQLVIAYTNAAYGGFAQRKVGGRAGVAIWDYISPGISRNIPAPCRYISALVPSPDGQLLAFGGVDEGKSSIYSFTGYGFSLLHQYVGDMPRSRHSVEFDSQGRILFQTVDGQLCRYDRSSGIFEHLDSMTTGSSAGGILAKGIGSPTGNEFFIASGSGSSYALKKVQFGSYIGDDNSASDTVATPLVISGVQQMQAKSVIQAITLCLSKPLETGERVELRVYKNGSTTDYTTYLTMDYSQDGAISAKREVLTISDINSYNLAVVWKQADGLTTAPPVLPALVEEENIYG